MKAVSSAMEMRRIAGIATIKGKQSRDLVTFRSFESQGSLISVSYLSQAFGDLESLPKSLHCDESRCVRRRRLSSDTLYDYRGRLDDRS